MFFKSIFKKKKKNSKEKLKYQFDINNWMNLSKEERLDIDFKEKDESMRKKKGVVKID